MKKFLIAVLAALALPALAQNTYITPPPWYVKAQITVAAGAVINSAVYDTSKATQVTVLVDNSAAAGARNLSYKCLATDGTTALYTSPDIAVSNAAPGNAALLLDARVSSATAATRETVHPLTGCQKMSFHLAAAGAAAATLAVYIR